MKVEMIKAVKSYRRYGPDEIKRCGVCGDLYPECFDHDKKAVAYWLFEGGSGNYTDEKNTGCPHC